MTKIKSKNAISFLVALFLVFLFLGNGKVYGDIQQHFDKNQSIFSIKNNAYFSNGMKIGVYPLVRVIDGDTIVVEVEGEDKYVRFVGINTPEIANRYNKEGECFGEEAKEYLESMLYEQERVILISDPSQGDVDKYNRLLRYVFLEDWTNVNLLMVLSGHAYEYTYYPNKSAYIFQAYFRWAEDVARILGRGLWSGCYCSGVMYCS